MPRLSIDITPEEHQKLKAVATLNGQSIKDFVLSRTLQNIPSIHAMSTANAMQALTDFLDGRIAEAERGETVEIAAGGLTKHIKDRSKQRHGYA